MQKAKQRPPEKPAVSKYASKGARHVYHLETVDPARVAREAAAVVRKRQLDLRAKPGPSDLRPKI